MNKQELQKQANGLRSMSLDKCVLVDKSATLGPINQLDEPKKVVIPQYVANWLEMCKDNGCTLVYALTTDLPVVMRNWLFPINRFTKRQNEEVFARAWIEGYEVEQEKLYTVEIPNPNKPDKNTNVLSKNAEGKVFLDVYLEDDNLWKNESICQLTEAEIKKDFEWAWQWAEEVEET